MSYDFTADDVFEMAGQLERNGAAFYRGAAERLADDPAAREMLLGLAEMEDNHERLFADMRASLTDADTAVTVFDPNGDAVHYLRALADTRVFFQKTVDTSSMKEILKAAIEAEKDSIVFYLGMKEAVPEKHGKRRLDTILKEEMGHIRMLSKELMALK